MAISTQPRVAIIGRMNVGKSMLFNCLTASRKAIVSSWAGTTRDAKEAEMVWRGRSFTLVDTGGLDVQEDEQLSARVTAVAEKAMQQADLILFTLDGQASIMPRDKALLKKIRTNSRLTAPVFLLVNKIDNQRAELAVQDDFYKINVEPIFFVSAKNGRGTGDLLDAVAQKLRQTVTANEREIRTKVAIVGRPNVGKSSLLNAILGEQRAVVADQAHTTRDANDVAFTYGDQKFLLIDTAGIRKQSRIGQHWADPRLGLIEKECVRAAIGAIKRADVVLVVLEAQKRVTSQDKKITSLAEAAGRGVILVINKWDLIAEKNASTIDDFSKYFDAALPFLRWAPIIFISAEEKVRTREVLDLVLRVARNYRRQLSAAELASLLTKLPNRSRTRKNKFGKIPAGFKYYGLEQTSVAPPTFLLKVQKPKDLPAAVTRILERELRECYDFEGVQIKIIIDDK